MSAEVYDLQYPKDWDGETARLADLARQYGVTGSMSWLDVACGTGNHLRHAEGRFASAAGTDISPHMLARAAAQLPEDVALCQADMVGLDLSRWFDIITCLFSAVAYLATEKKLRDGVAAMARHTRPGGLVMIEPWLHPDEFTANGQLHATTAHTDEADLARWLVLHGPPGGEEGIVEMDMSFLYSRPGPDGRLRIDSFSEHHTLGLFTRETYCKALEAAGAIMVGIEPPPRDLPDVRPMLIAQIPSGSL